ncbi:MAG: hypothetical protein JNM59_07090 [Hyphomonadaceae bacterium]|nr:hypothetical protein [Hyphomonadaceae bacterium]
MPERLVVVLDIGKTHAKLSLWSPGGDLVRRERRANARVAGPHYSTLDVAGIEDWLTETLKGFGSVGDIGAIVPVAHGAAAAIIRDGGLAAPVMDYEFDPPPELRATYRAQRSAFSETGSPAMGMALNLGLQLHCIEHFYPEALHGDAQILPWAQYWAWRLTGVAVSEVSSLGAHTDLWAPEQRAPSAMARRRGWAQRLAPRRRAHERLGPLTEKWRARTGLGQDVMVHAGVHDSNAALCSARAHPEFANTDATLTSTGTWFVSMRAPASEAGAPKLLENSGCLFNVDVEENPVPTALFMGGREAELLGGARLDDAGRQQALVAASARVMAMGAMALPSMVEGAGFFPDAAGAWRDEPPDRTERDAAIALYLALMTDVGLGRIESTGTVLVEGRFANCELFTRALAALRPRDSIYVSADESDVSLGALRLICPARGGAGVLKRVAPLDHDIAEYRSAWRAQISARTRRA